MSKSVACLNFYNSKKLKPEIIVCVALDVPIALASKSINNFPSNSCSLTLFLLFFYMTTEITFSHDVAVSVNLSFKREHRILINFLTA